MTDEIERLLALGRKDLEAGYPQYARQYFEKVLALDAANREAIDALARIDELRRRAAVPVRPIRGEPDVNRRGRESEVSVTKLLLRILGGIFFGLGAILFIGVLCSGTGIMFELFFTPGEPLTSDVLTGLLIAGLGFVLCLGVGSGLFYATRQRREAPAGAADAGLQRPQDDGGLHRPGGE
jgi:hypothetical protein